MGKIVTCAVNKGGVGKTTTSVALASLAFNQGLRVCFVDFDVQANGTKQFYSRKNSEDCLSSGDLFELKKEDVSLKKVCFIEGKKGFIEADSTYFEALNNKNKLRFAVIPATDSLLSVERLPTNVIPSFVANLKELSNHFDLVVCDTPPTKGFGMLAPLLASNFAYSPINPDAFSADGVASIFSKIKEIKSKGNPSLEFIGILINRLNTHSPLQKEVSNELVKKLGKMVIPQVIIERSAINNASFSKRPVWYQVKSGASKKASDEMKMAMNQLLNKMNLGIKEKV